MLKCDAVGGWERSVSQREMLVMLRWSWVHEHSFGYLSGSTVIQKRYFVSHIPLYPTLSLFVSLFQFYSVSSLMYIIISLFLRLSLSLWCWLVTFLHLNVWWLCQSHLFWVSLSFIMSLSRSALPHSLIHCLSAAFCLVFSLLPLDICDLFYTPASTCFQSLFQNCCHPLSPLSPLLLRLSHPFLITIDWLLKVTPSKDLGGCWCTTGITVTAINLSFDVELRHCVCLSVCVCVGGCGKGQRWIYNAKRLIVCALHSWKSNIITKKRNEECYCNISLPVLGIFRSGLLLFSWVRQQSAYVLMCVFKKWDEKFMIKK